MRSYLTNFLRCFLLICFLLSSPLVTVAAEKEAVFAGGCFWCLEHDLETLPGVIGAESGYTGGKSLNPTYRAHQGHQEAVRVKFDPEKISYQDLLRSYWRNIDPFNDQGQFCDLGDSYRPLIFLSDDIQADEVEKSFKSAAHELNVSIDTIKVQVQNLERFWLAEDYHQNYAIRNNLKYSFYRLNCGRDRRLDKIWGVAARSSQPWQ